MAIGFTDTDFASTGHWTSVPESYLNTNILPLNMPNHKKYTLKEFNDLAELRGGFCLSTEYINANTNLKWKCKFGHIWETTPNHIIKNNTWCKKCIALKRRLTLETLQEIAQSKKGKCLSNSYQNSASPLEWRCEKNHTWFSRPADVKRGHWCPYCAGIARLDIAKMHDLAKINNGKCLSDIYLNNRQKLKWRCELGHEWLAIPQHIKKGHWCPTCRHKLAGLKIRLIKLGTKTSDEIKKKLSLAHKGKKSYIRTPEIRLKLSLAHKGKRKHSESHKEELRLKMLGKNNPFYNKSHTDESKAKLKMARLHRVLPLKDSSIEKKLQEALFWKSIPFKTHINLEGQPDIQIGNLLVFADGDYHHANPDMHKANEVIWPSKGTTAEMIWTRDKKVTRELQSQGYIVLRFWEHEINMNLLACVNKIINKIGESQGGTVSMISVLKENTK